MGLSPSLVGVGLAWPAPKLLEIALAIGGWFWPEVARAKIARNSSRPPRAVRSPSEYRAQTPTMEGLEQFWKTFIFSSLPVGIRRMHMCWHSFLYWHLRIIFGTSITISNRCTWLRVAV